MEFLAFAQPYLPLTLLVFLAGFVDSIAGGGGLITLPAYLAYGLNPALLLGTNKLSSSMGTAVAAFRFFREARLRADLLFILVFLGAAGAGLGAWAISLVPPETVRWLLLVLLPPVAVFLAARKDFGFGDTSRRFSEGALLARSGAIGFGVSFYDGLLGPGTGTFLALAFTRLCGYDLLRATALAKLLNLVSNLAALAAFLWLGRVDLRLGLAMGLAGMAGNYAGAHLALKKGAWVIRPMLLLVSGALLAKIAWDLFK
ncbi:MAG: TSUP family transporter [Elusimicrobiales bacterium]|nr:TSUP family transporter [Elusimicrobiales bacterium]